MHFFSSKNINKNLFIFWLDFLVLQLAHSNWSFFSSLSHSYTLFHPPYLTHPPTPLLIQSSLHHQHLPGLMQLHYTLKKCTIRKKIKYSVHHIYSVLHHHKTNPSIPFPFTAPKTVTALIYPVASPWTQKTIYFFLHFFTFFFFQLFLQLSSIPSSWLSTTEFFQFPSLLLYFLLFPNHCHAFLPCVLAASHTPFSFHSNRPRLHSFFFLSLSLSL